MLHNITYNGTSMFPGIRGHLERPHLNSLLKKAIQKPFVTVIAGAGYGKTQAIAALLQDNILNTIWLQLSSLDNITNRLWDRFSYSFSQFNEELTEKLAYIGFPDSNESFNIYLELIAEIMKPDEKYFIVFDDFHLIYDKSIIRFIDRYINARIANLTIILISRSEIPINTVSLSSKGMHFSITEDDLRFKKNDIKNYFEMYEIKLTEQDVSKIYEYTDGWILAIYLIGLSLKKRTGYKKLLFSEIILDIYLNDKK